MEDADALLSQLRGLHTPPISQFPALGWWLLLLLACLAVALVWSALKRHRQRTWVRQAQQELLQLRQRSDKRPVSESLADVSKLARRVMLASRPRETVASLHGEPWLKELDALCGRELFSQGYGRMLLDAQYRPDTSIKASDLSGLYDAMHELITSAGKGRKIRNRSDSRRTEQDVSRADS